MGEFRRRSQRAKDSRYFSPPPPLVGLRRSFRGNHGANLEFFRHFPTNLSHKSFLRWDLVVHPVTQVIGEQALVDILDLSEDAWNCWGVSTPSSGLGLRMVKELDLQLALGMNEIR